MSGPPPFAVLAALAILGGPAGAATPTPARPDARVRTVDYDPAQVVRITGRLRTATQVVFAPGETVLHVALGDSDAWQTAAAANVLFLKPRTPAAPTDLIVTTAHGETTRSYVFELVTVHGGAARPAAYVLRFRYPADAAAATLAAQQAAAEAADGTLAAARLERAAREGPRNLAYLAQGPSALAPVEVSDNGRFTLLRFPGAQPLPAIYLVGPDGSEALAAFDVRGDTVVVHGVAPGLRLRRGRQMVCLTNQAYRPAATATPSLTAAPDVARTLRSDRP